MILARTVRLTECARRIRELEPSVGAWEHVDFEIMERWSVSLRATASDSAIAGLPVGIKDVFDTADMPTTYGSQLYAGHQPKEDAWVVRRLREAGAVIIGKTVTTEFAYLQPARTANPLDLARTPGGSSSGSAAAVASGMVALALGTQTAGSTIRPAAYCGVFGFKPTFGVVPMQGCRPLAPSLDTVGMFSRELPLLGKLAQTLSNGFIRSGTLSASTAPRVRLASPRTWGCEDQMHELFDFVAKRLALAASCEEAQLPATEVTRLHRLILSYEAASEYRELVRTNESRVSEPFRALVEEGSSHTAAGYQEALLHTAELRTLFDHKFADFDVLVLPSATGEAPLRTSGTGNPDCCRLASLLGLPAINVPAGTGRSGLPLGIQLVCKAGDDSKLLQLAGWMASVLQSGYDASR